MIKPNYSDLGLSLCLGPELRKEVERQLLVDNSKYNISMKNIKFDWSESCIEGHRASYLDGAVENFSGIKMFDCNDDYIGEGWMEFVIEKSKEVFIVFWEFLDGIRDGKEVPLKDKPGIPDHVYDLLPDMLKPKYANRKA